MGEVLAGYVTAMKRRFEISRTFHDGTVNVVDKRHRDNPADAMREHFLFGLSIEDRFELAKLLLLSIPENHGISPENIRHGHDRCNDRR